MEPDEQARRVASDLGVTVHDGTAEALPGPVAAGCFDCVVLSHVLEHCIDAHRALRNAHGCVRPGGWLICEVPNNQSLQARRMGVCWSHLDVPRHLNFFTPRSLRSAAERAGFEVIEVQWTGYCRQFLPEHIKAQRAIYQTYRGNGRAAVPSMRWHSSFEAWTQLLTSALSRPERKYDSARIIGRRTATRSSGDTPGAMK